MLIGKHLNVDVIKDGKGGRLFRAQGNPAGVQERFKDPEELEALAYEFLKEAAKWRDEREEG